MLYLKFVHVACMFVAVTLLVGGSIDAWWIARQGDREALIGFGRNIGRLETVGIAFFILAIVFGFATALSGNLDLTQPWLLIAYALVVALFIPGPLESRLYARELERLQAEESSGSAAIAGSIALGRATVLTFVSAALYLVIIFDMIVKPFS